MRDPKRIEKIVDALRKYWVNNPDLRLGQIVSILAHRVLLAKDAKDGYKKPYSSIEPTVDTIFYMEDDDILPILEWMENEQKIEVSPQFFKRMINILDKDADKDAKQP